MGWIDADGDKTKSVLIIKYSDGTTDKLIVNKKDLNKGGVSKINEAVEKVLNEKFKGDSK